MMLPSEDIPICDCKRIEVRPRADDRGCLFEIFRQSWDGAFPTVQWNACASDAGVVRGVHVHVDYHEFYTLPRGKVVIGLADIRSESPTFGRSHQFEWTSEDGFAVVVPIGVAHVVWFLADSVLAFGLSDYWKAELDVVGCQWNDPALDFHWPEHSPVRSRRDRESGTYHEMIESYEEKRRVVQSTLAT